MKRSITIFLCLFIGIISCKKSTISDSGLTSLEIKDITDTLNKKMQTSEDTKNLTINFVTLKISPTTSSSDCSLETIVPKTEINKFNTTPEFKNFTLKTACIYTLNMEYGTNNKAYFTGETTIGTKIGDIDNSYNNAGSGTTKVTIKLTFNTTGENFTIQAAEGTATTTDVVINPKIVNGSSTITPKDLAVSSCKFINDVEVYSNKISNLFGYGFLVEGKRDDCLNKQLLLQLGFTKNNPISYATGAATFYLIYKNKLSSLEQGKYYTLIMTKLGSNTNTNLPQFPIRSDASLNLDSETSIRICALEWLMDATEYKDLQSSTGKTYTLPNEKIIWEYVTEFRKK